MIERRYLLLYTYKAFIYMSIISVVYIFTAGLFSSSEVEPTPENEPTYAFSLATLKNNSHAYFKTERREILVIKTEKNYAVFWANDPIYGCRLNVNNSTIRPVCIDIEYDLNGHDKKTGQQLSSPDFFINTNNELIVER